MQLIMINRLTALIINKRTVFNFNILKNVAALLLQSSGHRFQGKSPLYFSVIPLL